MPRMNRVVRLYGGILGLVSFGTGLLGPVLVAHYRDLSFSLFQIGLFSSIFELSIFVCEVPTGLVADRYGRKLSVGLAFCCFILTGSCYLLSSGLPILLAANALYGIGCTFISGALQAWLVESLREIEGCTPSLEQPLLAGVRLRSVGFLIGSLTGGLFFAAKQIVWLLYTCAGLAGLILTCLVMDESPGSRSQRAAKPGGLRQAATSLRRMSVGLGDRKRLILFLAATCLLLEFCHSPVDEYWPVIFTERISIPHFWLGCLQALPTLTVIGLGDRVLSRLTKRASTLQALFAVSAIQAAALLVLAHVHLAPTAVVSFWAYRSLMGVSEPLRDARLNQVVEDEHRATALSLFSMVGALGEVLSGVLMGAVTESLGISLSLTVCAVLLLLLGFAYAHLRNAGRKAGSRAA